MSAFTRWAVVFIHDGSPIDGGIFTHKAAAIKAKEKKSNAKSLRVTKIVISELAHNG